MKDNTIATKKEKIEDETNFRFVNFDDQSLKEQAYHILTYLLSEPLQTLIPGARVELLKETLGDWEPNIFGNKSLTENIDEVIDNFKLESTFWKLRKQTPSCKENLNDENKQESEIDLKFNPNLAAVLQPIKIDPTVHNKTFKQRNPCKEIKMTGISPDDEKFLVPCYPSSNVTKAADEKIREEWSEFKRVISERKDVLTFKIAGIDSRPAIQKIKEEIKGSKPLFAGQTK